MRLSTARRVIKAARKAHQKAGLREVTYGIRSDPEACKLHDPAITPLHGQKVVFAVGLPPNGLAAKYLWPEDFGIR